LRGSRDFQVGDPGHLVENLDLAVISVAGWRLIDREGSDACLHFGLLVVSLDLVYGGLRNSLRDI